MPGPLCFTCLNYAHTHTRVGVHAQVDEILVWIKDALLALESVAVDQTEHNLRIMLDLGVANVLRMCCLCGVNVLLTEHNLRIMLDLGVAYVLLNVLLMWC